MPASCPLKGIHVLDLSRVLAGPVCTQVLSDLGADVIKVERPGVGDDTRHWGPPFLGPYSAYFLSVNRGKRSVTLDLKQPKARDVLEDLVRRSDVLLENFLPGPAAQLGVSPEQLARLNPKLIACSISGFGRSGPWKDVPGYDIVIQALSGLMSITGEPDGDPIKIGVAITDVLTGLYAAISVLAGLAGRSKDSAGCHFDVALLDCTLAGLVNVAQGYLVDLQLPRRHGNAHPHIVPYQAFRTSDGHLVLAVGNDGQWQRFCKAVGRDDLLNDPSYATNPQRVAHRGELVPEIANELGQHTTDEWIALLKHHDVPHAPVQDVAEALAHPQAQARGMLQESTLATGQELTSVASPIHQLTPSGAATLQNPSPPPALGQHTDEVLRDVLGYDEQRIKALRKCGALG